MKFLIPITLFLCLQGEIFLLNDRVVKAEDVLCLVKHPDMKVYPVEDPNIIWARSPYHMINNGLKYVIEFGFRPSDKAIVYRTIIE